jgi:hypothetical protein
VSLKAWVWISGTGAILLLAIPAVYTWVVWKRAYWELWSWGHQFVATFFSVGFAIAIGIWLYAWQTKKTTADKKRDLRAAILINIFDTWDRLDDRHLQSVKLPNGSEEKIVLTIVQPTVFEEAIRSGLFKATETFYLSRLAAMMHIYHDRAQRFAQVHKLPLHSTDGDQIDDNRVEELRSAIDGVQEARSKIAVAGENLLKLWSFDQLKEALDISKASDEAKEDPRVALIIRNALPEISPVSYLAPLDAKLGEVEEAIESGDAETACTLLHEIITDAQDLSNDTVRAGDVEQLITQVNQLRKDLSCPENRGGQ